jgi:hypothetical protein
MSIFGAIWKTAAWITLATGLYLNGNLDKIEEQPQPVHVSFANNRELHELPIGLQNRGDVPCALVITLPDHSIEQFESWLSGPPSGTASLIAIGDQGNVVDTWTVEGEGLNYLASVDEKNVILAEGVCSTQGAATLRAASELTGSFFLNHRPYILVGERPNEAISKSVERWMKHSDPKPGLLLLIGGTFVFLHLFFVVARVLVPDCKPTEFSSAL